MTSKPTPGRLDKKKERLSQANAIIEAMSRHGRRFFYNKDMNSTAHFLLDERGQLRFCDDYLQKPFIPKSVVNWNRCFSHGGTMRSLVEALALYIREGKQISPRHFGPWPDYLCDGDLWGYGHQAMEDLRAEIMGSPAIAQSMKLAA